MKSTRLAARISPLLVVIFIDSIGYTIVVPVLAAALIDEPAQLLSHASVALRYLTYGVAIGIYELAMLYAAPILGEISDSFGRKRILILSMAGVLVSFLLIGAALSFNMVALLIIARMIGGLTAGGQSVAQAAAVDASTDQERARALNLCLFASSLGFIAGPLIGGALSHDEHVLLTDFSIPMFATAAIAACGIALLAFGFQETRPRSPGPVQINLWRGISSFRDALGVPHIRRLMLIFGLMQIAWGTYFLYLPTLLLNRFDQDAGEVSILMAVMGAGFCIAYGFCLPFLEKRASARSVAIFGLWCTLGLMTLSIAAGSMTAQWLIALPVAITVSVAYGAIINLFSRSVSDEHQGWILGISISLNAFVWGMSSIVSGLLSGWNYVAPFIMCLIALTFASVLMTMLGHRPAAAEFARGTE